LKTERDLPFSDLARDQTYRWYGITPTRPALKNFARQEGDVWSILSRSGSRPRSGLGLADNRQEAYGDPAVVDVRAKSGVEETITHGEMQSRQAVKERPLSTRPPVIFLLTDDRSPAFYGRDRMSCFGTLSAAPRENRCGALLANARRNDTPRLFPPSSWSGITVRQTSGGHHRRGLACRPARPTASPGSRRTETLTSFAINRLAFLPEKFPNASP